MKKRILYLIFSTFVLVLMALTPLQMWGQECGSGRTVVNCNMFAYCCDVVCVVTDRYTGAYCSQYCNSVPKAARCEYQVRLDFDPVCGPDGNPCSPCFGECFCAQVTDWVDACDGTYETVCSETENDYCSGCFANDQNANDNNKAKIILAKLHTGRRGPADPDRGKGKGTDKPKKKHKTPGQAWQEELARRKAA